MDFEFAAQRLKRDQATMRPSSSSRRNRSVSERAKRQADAMKRRQMELMEEKRLRRRREEYRDAYMNRCERSLGIRSLKMSNGGGYPNGEKSEGGLELHATSIHGDGDKIALPPSVLGFLTEQQMSSSSSSSSPWIFRIGIRDPEYTYPASSLMRDLEPPKDGDDSQPMDDEGDDDDGEDVADADRRMDAYLDELNHKYLSYTHATVVEFTQEEGYVGLPELISKALLRPSSSLSSRQQPQKIPVMRTVDRASAPASAAASDAAALQETDAAVSADARAPMDVDDNDGGDKTPGHLAWGAFDLPDMPIEISLVRLPKGEACKLCPTKEAIMSGFYNLKDVKMVLEQSLIRTRATLSTNDTVHTWHRGIRYDVRVTSVTPRLCDAIVCINTDIEVDFDAPEEEAATTTTTTQPKQPQHDKHTSKDANNSNSGTGSADSTSGLFSSLGGGRTLASSSSTSAQQPQRQSASAAASATTTTVPLARELPPEPPSEQKEHVCTVQLRGGNATTHGGGSGSSSSGGGNGRRRFDVTKATVGDLFAFAYHVLGGGGGGGVAPSFSLVTRFPRRVLTTEMSNTTLQDAGISQGQELFMIERV